MKSKRQQKERRRQCKDRGRWITLDLSLQPEDLKQLRRRRRCKECGQPVSVEGQLYQVRDETWSAAGMRGWASGLLHMACLEKRLGRKLREEELLTRFVRFLNENGDRFRGQVRPEYLESLGILAAP
jgi:hypothetical protein